jgi:hypothetical protein
MYSLNEDITWIWINLLISVLLLPVPFNFLLPELLGVTEEELNNRNYNEIYLTLHEDYERANPITKKTGLQRFVEVLKENEIITSENFLKLMEDIDNKQSNNIENYYSNNDSLQKNIIHQQKNKFLSIVNKNITKFNERESKLSISVLKKN